MESSRHYFELIQNLLFSQRDNSNTCSYFFDMVISDLDQSYLPHSQQPNAYDFGRYGKKNLEQIIRDITKYTSAKIVEHH